jgi:hypothetical protein
LHTAQHGGSFRDRAALARAIDRASDDRWSAAAQLANSVAATAAFQRGLEFLPAGRQLAARLELHAAPEVHVELRARQTPEALTLAHLLAADNLRVRFAIVRHKLVPPVTYMRKWSPMASRGYIGLAAAYLWRPVWVMSRLPAAMAAFIRARRH